MILVDVNVLLYAEDSTSAHHRQMKGWWDSLLSGSEEIALCWPVLSGFMRITTNPRILLNPMTTEEACTKVNRWLAQPCVRLVTPTARHWNLFSELMKKVQATANLVPDAHLAALAIEHDCVLASCDTDFAKFPGLRWINPLKA